MNLADLKKKFQDFPDADPIELTGDAKLRAENPGLQELWDQYQTMLKLIKPAPERLPGPATADELLAMIRAKKTKS